MLEVATFVGIDEVVLLGNYCDMYEVSRHPKDKRIKAHLTEEVKSVNDGLDEIDKLFPKAKKVYLEGNHEIRLENYLLQIAPALFGVTEIKALFQLNKRPLWSYQGFGRNQAYRVLGSDLFARHRPLANNALSGLQRAGVSYVYGDIHKIQEAQAIALDGSTRVAFCPGWLGETRHRVFDYMISPAQWQHGFAIVSKDEASRAFHHEIVQIKNNIAITHGKRFK